ncbi:hypothetical protein Rsub_01235 [Raphidocelis subcapitata]|uniref:Uncharacterized protein n=1 Tax=Raphidocelis subcapitata TaxID=307507 RepID=A0A2V0NSH2_9CHLO|nr:hypothetical protein Rsub_01235 [Raphidocelis subcapitata]|eukprot:GBF88520.1 hypothetical protein Rsub_01235 [Raphidocelis subcapitata]
MLLRVRVSSFLAGFGLASAAAFWQLRNDINTSSQFLAVQAQEARDTLERRVAALEAAMLPRQPAPAAAPADTGVSSIDELAEVLSAASAIEAE